MTEESLREKICQIGRLMHQFQFADGTSGNISARLDSERVLISPSGLAKGFMSPDQLIIIDMDGTKIGDPTPANENLHPSSETPMHLEAYKKRPDIHGVVHAHPTYAIALTVAGINFQQYTIPESIIMLGNVPIAPFSTPATTENRDAISELVQHHNALMLAYHGSLTLGRDVWEAYLMLETLEHSAKITATVHQLGGGKPLAKAQLEKLHQVRQRAGLAIPNEPY